MLQGLEHSQLVVDHPLVPLDVLLEDDLDGYPPRGTLSLANDAIGSGAQSLSKSVLGPVSKRTEVSCYSCIGDRSGAWVGAYFFS